jgi:hypothetical protein
MRAGVIVALALWLQTPQVPELRWFKGNTHTHTLNSDGDSTPDQVVTWYRTHGYNFLVITDHEFITPVEPLNALFGAENRFLMIPGQEVTGRAESKPVHMNAIGATKVVMPVTAPTIFEVLQRDATLVKATGAIVQINHPNFGWALSGNDLARVNDARLVEIWNGHPLVNNLGGGGTPSAEAMWDTALTAGRTLFAIADDDAHHFRAERIADPTAATSGHGWIYVRAARLDAPSILAAIDRGDFYASSGVELSAIDATAAGLSVTIKAEPASRYRVEFVGAGGKVLAESTASPAVYTFTGTEQYVRARVFESNGKRAWTQPVFLKK